LRINKGILKSRRFSIPKQFPSRPTTDFAKEALFNILEHRIPFYQLQILDLCAGTGNISFEFASREAGKIIAVDKNFNCVQFIRKTAKDFGVDEAIDVLKSDALRYLEQTGLQFDIIFCDPPFDADFHRQIIDKVFERSLLKPNGWLVVEHGKDVKLEEISYFHDEKKYGSVFFTFFKNEQ